MLLLTVVVYLAIPVRSMDFQPPEAPERVADVVEEPADSFGQGLWNVMKFALSSVDGTLKDAMGICLGCASSVMLCALLREVTSGAGSRAVELACCTAVSGMLLQPSTALVRLGMDTAVELSEYGKLLLPVMTGAMAARGGVSSSTALYAGTALFDSLLSSLLPRLIQPLIWIYLALRIADSVLNEPLLGKMGAFLSWSMGWVLKIVLYLFTGYMAVTGVVSGSADAAAVRAAKAAISTAVPVVGGILSDASEAVLITAGTLGSAAGVYGMITVLALFSGPFLRIGIQYLFLKGTAALCAAFDGGSSAQLLEGFSVAMGLVLGMVGSQTVLIMISTMCLMKGVA